jgi:hypothetical protein
MGVQILGEVMPTPPTTLSTPEVESARRAARSAIAILTPGTSFQQAEDALAAIILDCQADAVHEALGAVMFLHNGLRRAALNLREPS